MLQMHKTYKTPKTFGEKKQKEKKVLPYLQRIGKSLLFPIAILPIAAIFLRISALVPDTTTFSKLVGSILGSIGNAVFGPILPVLFAIGVAFGLSKDQRGEAAIVGFVAMMLLQIFLSLKGQGFAGAGIGLVDQIYGNINVRLEPLENPETKLPVIGSEANGFKGLLSFYKQVDNKWIIDTSMYTSVMVNNVLNGIAIGILVSVIYNNFQGIELPSVLGFFSGRRLIPVLTLIIGVIFSIIWAILFPWIAWCVYYLSYYMSKATGNRYANAGIMGAYGFINRLLIPFGLHHIPNTLFWFAIGETQDVSGNHILGDIYGFINGAPSWTDSNGTHYNNCGTFQSGIFPFMMFGLPAIAFAFYKLADNKEQAKKVAALLFGSAGIAFFTGITEPIEFAFMFISPGLYLIYAALCGVCGFVVGLFQIQLGFGFSAGLIDYILSIPKSLEIIKAKVDGDIYTKVDAILANPGMLLPIGLVFSIIYYYTFKLCIVKFNMAAPGRSPNLLVDDEEEEEISASGQNKDSKDAAMIIDSIGINNLDKVEWCTTRLRLTVKDNTKINLDQIKRTRSRGEIKSGTTGFQIVIGPTVEILGNEINRLLLNTNEIEQIISSLNNKKEVIREQINDKQQLLVSKVYAPCIGKVEKLDTLKDDVFKNKLVGDGLVINSKDGKVYAPFDGKITMVADTKHAINIESVDTNNVLIHIGIDTVKLDGKAFTLKVKQGDEVKKGQLLLVFDKKQIKDQKLDNRVIVLLTNDSKSKINKFTKETNVDKTKVLFTIK